MNEETQYDLERFIQAQQRDFETALGEIKNGQKQSHWIWYIFPQVAGLGNSVMAKKYAIASKAEAVAYLQHEVLGQRLQQCAQALLQYSDKSINSIMGFPDDLKLKSSMTLFTAISPPHNLFAKVLDTFYGGEVDEATIKFLENNPK